MTERQRVVFWLLFFGDDREFIGITDDGQYVYCMCTGSSDNMELYALSHEEYLRFVMAYQEKNAAFLNDFRRDVFMKPSMAFEASPNEPKPVMYPQYGAPKYGEYISAITQNTVISAECDEHTITIYSKAKQFKFNKSDLSKNQKF